MDRFLIAGYGSIGKRHLRIVRELHPDAMIMVLRHQATTVVPEGANFVACSMQDVRSFAPQAAVIANPAPLHLKLAEDLSSLGCHVLIEKPISHRTEGAMEILERIRDRGIICQVGYNLRYLPSLSRFRDLIYEGLAGVPFSVRCDVGQYLPSWRPGSDYRHGVSANSHLGGGALLEVSHEIDYLCWIFGNVEWVSGWVGNVSSLNIDVEDTAHLILGFEAKDQASPIIANLNIDFVRHDTTRTCTVIGSDSSLRWDGLTGSIAIHKAGGTGWEEYAAIAHSRDDSYYAQWANFITCIKQRVEPLVDGRSGIKVVEIVEAAKASAKSGGVKTCLL